MEMTPKQFKNQNANWEDKYFTYAIHKTSGGAMYLFQIDGHKITTETIKGALITRLDGVDLDKLVENIRKVKASDFVDKEDIYDRTYDYDDMKIALCIQDFLDNDNPDMQINFQDFEDIVELAIRIRKSYDKCNKEGTLTKEEQGYIQQFAYNYLKENYGD